MCLWGLATLLHVSTSKFLKVNSKYVLNSFLAVFRRKVGVYYVFNSEISYQSWCREKKICQSEVLKVLKVLKSEKLRVKFHCFYHFYDGGSFFRNFKCLLVDINHGQRGGGAKMSNI